MDIGPVKKEKLLLLNENDIRDNKTQCIKIYFLYTGFYLYCNDSICSMYVVFNFYILNPINFIL